MLADDRTRSDAVAPVRRSHDGLDGPALPRFPSLVGVGGFASGDSTTEFSGGMVPESVLDESTSKCFQILDQLLTLRIGQWCCGLAVSVGWIHGQHFHQGQS